jgi:hypothetical protein
MEPDGVNRELLTRSVPYACRILDAEEVRALSRDPDNQMSPAFVARMLAKDDVCFGVLDGEVLASYGWYSSGATTLLETVTVKFDPRYLYMYRGYTRPAYRGQNLHGVGLARACASLCSRGHAGIVTAAERVNFTSLHSAHRVGYRDIGTAVVVRAGKRTRIWQTRVSERYGMKLEPSTPLDAEELA